MVTRRTGFVVAAVVAAAAVIPAVTFSATPTAHGYVASAIELPANGSEAKSLGRDINGDGHPDNALGQFFAALTISGLDFRGITQDAVTNGDLLMLGSLRARSLVKDRKASWQVLYAKPTHPPDFSGAGSFMVDPVALRSATLPARIKKHHVTTAAGSIPVALSFGAGIATFWLRNAEISATCTRTGCSAGRITGVLMHSDLTNVFLPQLAGQFTSILTRDCPTPSSCANGTEGQTLETLFDTNQDAAISATELQQNSLIKAVLAPDIATKRHHKPDALSAGFGFTVVKASIKR
jgi:hypothetical protein